LWFDPIAIGVRMIQKFNKSSICCVQLVQCTVCEMSRSTTTTTTLRENNKVNLEQLQQCYAKIKISQLSFNTAHDKNWYQYNVKIFPSISFNVFRVCFSHFICNEYQFITNIARSLPLLPHIDFNKQGLKFSLELQHFSSICFLQIRRLSFHEK
jgi:hypothetical protein